jgi:hypothetical protein
VLAYCYNRLGQPELAQKIIQPGAVDSFEMNYPHLVRGAERTAMTYYCVESMTENTRWLLDHLADSIAKFGDPLDDEAAADAAAYRRWFLPIYRAMYAKRERHSYRPDAASDNARFFANLLLAFGEREEALQMLEKAVAAAQKFDAGDYPDGALPPDARPVYPPDFGRGWGALLAERLLDPRYDALRGDARFAELVRRLN